MADAKKVTANLKMRIPAGKATPAPPVGSILGQYGVNMMDFINPFNEQTQEMAGNDVGVKVTIYEDRTFKFTVTGIPTDDLIRKALGIQKGSGEPQKDKVGKLSRAQAEEIARQKMKDLNTEDIEAALKVIAGTARSMGVTVEGVKE